jgi:hypothetical protein
MGKNGGITRRIFLQPECIEQTKKALYGDYQLEDRNDYFSVV